MVARDTLSQIVKEVLLRYTRIPYAYGDLTCEAAFDDTNERYLLITVGWNGDRRVHNTLVHIDLKGDKLWVERDGTEDGIANELVERGIPREQIVLGFRSPGVRKHTGFALA